MKLCSLAVAAIPVTSLELRTTSNDCVFNVWDDTYLFVFDSWQFVQVPNESDLDCLISCSNSKDCLAFTYAVFESKLYNHTTRQCYHKSDFNFHSFATPFKWGNGAVVSTAIHSGVRSDWDWRNDQDFVGPASWQPWSARELGQPTQMSYDCPNEEKFCQTRDTDFGSVSYKDTTDEVYTNTYLPYQYHQDNSTTDCGKTCFETAGCNSFFVDGTCNMIIGKRRNPLDLGQSPFASNVTESGKFLYICPNTVFETSFTKKSRFFCKFLTKIQEDQFVQQLIDQNSRSGTPIKRWVFDTVQTSPLMKTSTFVDIKVTNPIEAVTNLYQPNWVLIQITVETHTRTAVDSSDERRINGEPVSFKSPEDMEALIKSFERNAHHENKRKRRDALDDLEDFESAFINSILTDMELPEGTQLLETTEVEVIEVSQVTTDGEVAADCSGGTCKCVEGYQDFGDGCELIPVWSEWEDGECSTECGPGTMTQTRFCGDGTRPEFCDGESQRSADCFQAYCDEDMTPDEGLAHVVKEGTNMIDDANLTGASPEKRKEKLKNRWIHLRNKFTKKYESLVNSDECSFPYADQTEFDLLATSTACEKIQFMRTAFKYFGQHFTDDCRKVKRSTNLKFFVRLQKKVDNATERTEKLLRQGGNC